MKGNNGSPSNNHIRSDNHKSHAKTTKSSVVLNIPTIQASPAVVAPAPAPAAAHSLIFHHDNSDNKVSFHGGTSPTRCVFCHCLVSCCNLLSLI